MSPAEVGRKPVGPQNKDDEFREEFRVHVVKCEDMFTQLISTQDKNTDAISSLIEETRDILRIHRDLQGAARMGVSAQKLGMWLAKWGAVGISLAALWNWGLKELTEIFK